MRKFLKFLVLGSFLLCLSGCGEDSLKNSQVYTTVYPIEYLVNYLYGEESNVSSIYPKGADVETYELTDKQKENYSKGKLFVYNGLTSEKELAREFLNQNSDLLLIDVAYGLNYEYALEELWLSPTSTVTVEAIEQKYEEIEETLSFMDAELRSVATDAKKDGTSTLVVSSSKLAFLENYGFNVIVLNGDISEDSLKNAFDEGTYTDIYLCDTDEKTEFITSLEEDYEANIISVDTLYTLSDEEANNNENYLTIMRDFIDHIRNTTLG